MSIELPENGTAGGEKESPIPTLRKELENLIDSKARQRLEEYVSARSTEPPYCWFTSTADAASDPIDPVIDLCCKICEMRAASGPFLFPDPDKDQVREIKRRTGNIKKQLNASLTILKKAHRRSAYYGTGDLSSGEPEPITDSDIKLVEKIIVRAWRWREYAWALETLHLPLPEKRTTRGRPALDHVNALEWELWQLLKCTGMKRRRVSYHIEQLLGFYDLSKRDQDSIEQRLIKKDKSPQS